MKVETRSAMILLVTLIIGAALGMVGQAFLRQERMRQGAELRRPPGFVSHMEEVISPRAEQQQAVRTVLERTAASNQTIIDSARTALRSALEAMQRELAPMLDSAQRTRLAEMSRLPDPFRPPPPRDGMRGGMRGEPPRDGPPPGR